MFRLCRELGFPHPDYLLEYLSGDQVAEWLAYSEVEPFGGWVWDYHVAKILAVISNLIRSFGVKKGDAPVWSTLMDFMPEWSDVFPKRKISKDQSTEEMKSILLGIAKTQNAKFNKSNTRPPKKWRKE